MAIRAIVLSRLLVLPTLLACSAFLSHAQDSETSKYPIVLKKITVTLVPSAPPPNDTNLTPNSPSANEHDWLKVQFQFDVNPVHGNYLNAASFHVWIEGRDLDDPNFPGPDGVGVAFSGVVNYVNLYKGPNGFGVVYLAPSTVERYAGRQGSSSFTRSYDVHIDASADGQKICFLNNRDEGNQAETWFQKLKPLAGLVHTLSQTPFFMTDYGLYPEEKLKGGAPVESSE